MNEAALPLALTGALWHPNAEGVAELVRDQATPPALIVAAHDPLEETLTALGYGDVVTVAVSAKVPLAPGQALVGVHDSSARRWDAAREIATLLLTASATDRSDREATELEPHTDHLATLLAAMAEEDDRFTLHLSGRPGSSWAGAVMLQTERTTLVPLAGGEAMPLVARLLAEGRATGKQAFWSYLCERSDPAATLRRWEVPA